MFLSTKGRYAMIAMTSLALMESEGYISLAKIASQEKLSRHFLEQLFMRLRKANLVNSIRGPNGGYKIAKPMHEITISEILDAVEEPIRRNTIGRGVKGGMSGTRAQSLNNRLWEGLSTEVSVYLHSVKLSDLVNNEITPCPAVTFLKKDGIKNSGQPQSLS
ncbi:MAG: Rrf2 family transcriptional regulator [Rhodobacteraceae bacterium]|nr:Rrf2 family transcriptional regulator [Paracoccaceae bacterium]